MATRHSFALGAVATIGVEAAALWLLYRYLPDPGVKRFEVHMKLPQEYVHAA